VFESWFDAKEIHEDEENTNSKILAQEQKNSVVNMLHQILLPFLRRRVKTDVGLEIPPKKVSKFLRNVQGLDPDPFQG